MLGAEIEKTREGMFVKKYSGKRIFKVVYGFVVSQSGKAKLMLDYFNVLPGLDLRVPLSIAINPKGKTSYAFSGLNEGASSFGIGVEGTYLGAYKAGISYTGFYGNPDDNAKTDRDYVSFTMKYTF